MPLQLKPRRLDGDIRGGMGILEGWVLCEYVGKKRTSVKEHDSSEYFGRFVKGWNTWQNDHLILRPLHLGIWIPRRHLPYLHMQKLVCFFFFVNCKSFLQQIDDHIFRLTVFIHGEINHSSIFPFIHSSIHGYEMLKVERPKNNILYYKT